MARRSEEGGGGQGDGERKKNKKGVGGASPVRCRLTKEEGKKGRLERGGKARRDEPGQGPTSKSDERAQTTQTTEPRTGHYEEAKVSKVSRLVK